MNSSRLEVEDNGEITVVEFIDPQILGEKKIQKIGENLFELVDLHGKVKILLSFGNVEHLSKDCLCKFIALNRKLREKNGKLVMCNMNKDVYKAFEGTRLSKLFNIQSDAAAALQAFA